MSLDSTAPHDGTDGLPDLIAVRSLHYLLVDDSPVIRLLLTQALLRQGVPRAHIRETDSALSALQRFHRDRPEVVFMGLTLTEEAVGPPGGSQARPDRAPPTRGVAVQGGEEVARQMMHQDPSVRLIVCTGAAGEDPRVRLLVRLGAFYVLLKPLQASHLRSLLTMLEMDLSISGPRSGVSPARPRGTEAGSGGRTKPPRPLGRSPLPSPPPR